MADVIARHERIVLQFSGGKDSLASLQMVRDHWAKITVAWVNSGDVFPETIELMDTVRARVPTSSKSRRISRSKSLTWGGRSI
jgi:phosphoadenosine phosphosulfate reductase